jgi:hypothetical protein
MHTGQDRWIQKELAFTPAKNATKPNPFKIVPLQPTRKRQLRDRRNVGESSCNSGDETGQKAQHFMFMMMMIWIIKRELPDFSKYLLLGRVTEDEDVRKYPPNTHITEQLHFQGYFEDQQPTYLPITVLESLHPRALYLLFVNIWEQLGGGGGM